MDKRSLQEQQKRIKPGECEKYIQVIIDPTIINEQFGSQIATFLSTLKVKMEVRSQLVPGIISWERSLHQTLMNEMDGKVNLTDKFQEESHILYIMMAKDFMQSIASETLHSSIKNIQEIYTDKALTLFVCGLKDWCRLNPKNVGRKAIETNLTELQLFSKVNHRLLETAADLGNAVMQFSKSIAEIPYKKQESEQLSDQNFYVANDNKDCVTVKGTIGLTNLWQHQLMKLPLASLETAEAIMGEYKLPRLLFDAYANCPNQTAAEQLLANIPVRRAGGPLTSVRKIGPELSKKVYLLYNSLDPQVIL